MNSLNKEKKAPLLYNESHSKNNSIKTQKKNDFIELKLGKESQSKKCYTQLTPKKPGLKKQSV